MNVAQRRGKGQENLKNQTILVPEENNYSFGGSTGSSCNSVHNNITEDPSASLLHVPNGATSTTAATISSSLPVPIDVHTPKGLMMNVPMGNGNGSSSAGVLVGNGGTTANVTMAKVRRNYCGTGPFDHKWLNLDCCGLFCAMITYMLHFYAIYTVVFILLPPWMNTDASNLVRTTGLGNNTTTTDVSNVAAAAARQMMVNSNNNSTNTEQQHTISWMGFFHRLSFTCIACLAIASHWYAMTTDPGSVPPDAQPIITVPDETTDRKNDKNITTTHNNNNNTENNTLDHTKNNNNNTNTALQNYLLEPPPSPSRSIATTAVKRVCRRCKSYKPYRAHHCSICQRCIIKMDHHCPWINNCVGIGNHKYFLLFIFYTSVSCLYSLLLIITRFTSCSNGINYHNHHFKGNNHHQMKLYRLHHPEQFQLANDNSAAIPHCLDRPTHLLFILALLVEAILFGLFTGCMMMDQMDVVRSKVTHIDRYKGGDDSVGSHTIAGVLEVFGVRARSNHKNTKITSSKSSRHTLRDGRFRWDWLSPFNPVCFPSYTIRDEVIGFCRPCFPSSSNYTNKKESVISVPLQSSFAKSVTTTSSKGSKGVHHKQSSLVEII